MSVGPTTVTSAAIARYGAQVANTIRIPRRAHLQLKFLDPEGVEHPFPEGVPVIVRLPGSGSPPQDDLAQTAADGRLTVIAHTAANGQDLAPFTLRFPLNRTPFICDPLGNSPPASPPAASPPAPLVYTESGEEAARGGKRFFSLPLWFQHHADWGLVNSDWTAQVTGTHARFDANRGVIEADPPNTPDIGSAAQPLVLVLDPHWQFVRFTYFDRHYGPSRGGVAGHGAPISVTPLPLEGYRPDVPTASPPRPSPPDGLQPSTVSNWTSGGANDRVQCLPWIIRYGDDHAALPALTGANFELRFYTATQAGQRWYVASRSATARELVELADADALLNPGPERLKYYDLPRVWRSRGYFTRGIAGSPPAGGKFFADLTDADVNAANVKTTPLVFSLDDIVLAAPGGSPPGHFVPVELEADEFVAVFNNRFDNSLPDSTPQGLYKSKAPAGASSPNYLPYSDVLRSGGQRNYLTDYPAWTRLVAARGSLFDVFDQRTPDDLHGSTVVGARAAVRWVNGTRPFPGVQSSEWVGPAGSEVLTARADRLPIPGRVLRPRPARVDRKYFSIQPFFEQRSPSRGQLYAAGSDENIGRYDMVLLRCCTVSDDQREEVAVNLHYHRGAFNFTAASPPAALPVSRQQFVHDLAQNVANRWSGNEASGPSRERALLLPRRASPPSAALRVPVVWFVQTLPVARAHCRADLVNVDRAWRSSDEGTGESGPNDHHQDTTRHNDFTSAHELGHLDALPDEYNERWAGAHGTAPHERLGVSYGELSPRANLPGDPYESDDRPGGNTGMMNGTQRLRNRYFWHSASWVRDITHVPLKVSLLDSGRRYENYSLPRHGQRGHTYYQWPLNAVANFVTGGGGNDLFLYVLGRDQFSARFAHGPIDGILVMVAKIAVDMPVWANQDTQETHRTTIAQEIARAFRDRLNGRWYARGTSGSGRFARCALHFVPQIVVDNHPSDADLQTEANSVKADFGFNFRLNVRRVVGPPAAAVWTGAPVQDTLTIQIASPMDTFPQLAGEVARMFGVVARPEAVTSNQWLPLVSQVLTAPVVFRLPRGASPP